MVLIINFLKIFLVLLLLLLFCFFLFIFYNTVYCTNLLSVGQTQSVGGGIVSDDRCH